MPKQTNTRATAYLDNQEGLTIDINIPVEKIAIWKKISVGDRIVTIDHDKKKQEVTITDQKQNDVKLNLKKDGTYEFIEPEVPEGINLTKISINKLTEILKETLPSGKKFIEKVPAKPTPETYKGVIFYTYRTLSQKRQIIIRAHELLKLKGRPGEYVSIRQAEATNNFAKTNAHFCPLTLKEVAKRVKDNATI